MKEDKKKQARKRDNPQEKDQEAGQATTIAPQQKEGDRENKEREEEKVTTGPRGSHVCTCYTKEPMEEHDDRDGGRPGIQDRV